MDNISLDDIKDKLEFFNKMYDAVRLVDPEHKKVLDFKDSSLLGTQEVCYDYWGNGKICDNCISVRAFQENQSFVKLERSKEAILLVTAVPIESTDVPVVLELLKNATDTMMIGSGDYNDGEMFRRFVRDMNDRIVRDSLTSLYNRRFVDERLPVDMIEATLHQLPLSLCFMDLDNFKSINDVYGHEEGDLAIKAVGDVIAEHIRLDHDWAARYGGDEFLLCLKNADERDAVRIAERMQNEIEKISIGPPLEDVCLTVSFGIATMRDMPVTAKELLRCADRNMYKAKKVRQQNQNSGDC